MPQKTAENAQILLIDKPKGKTSYDVIRALKRRFQGQKIGHAGTLDPNATGLLLVGIGEGTKKLSELLKLPKKYDAEVLFGLRTDTGDITGKPIEESDASALDESALKNAVAELIGKHLYRLPAYSAVKQGGIPLYKKARAGEVVVPPVREMEVTEAEIKSFYIKNQYAYARITFNVGSGTYIRTLAEELGRKLKVPATLKELRRTKIGEFKIEGAEKI